MKKALLVLVLLALLYSCKSTKPSGSVSNTSELSKNNSTAANSAFIASTDFLIDGKRAELREDFSEAENLYQKSLKSNPENHTAYFLLSQLYANKNKLKAIEYAKTSLKLSPNFVPYHENLLTLYKQNKNYAEAAQEFEKIIKLEPNEKQNYYDFANFYIYLENYDKALEVYNRFSDKFGFDEGISLQRKQIYLSQKKFSKALEELAVLIENNPKNVDFLGMAAELSIANGDKNSAKNYCKKILELEPNEGMVHLVLSDIYESEQKNDLAFNEKKAAIKSADLSIDTKIGVLTKLNEKMRIDSSKIQEYSILLSELVIAHPNEGKALAMQADFYTSQNNYVEARKLFRQIIAVDSSKFLIWKQLILFEKEFGEYDSMADEASRAVTLFPMQAELYYFKAFANFRIGNSAEALQALDFGKSFCYSPMQQTEFQLLSAEIQIEKANLDLAERYLKSLAENTTKNPNLFRVQAKMEQKKGSTFEIIDSKYKTAISLQPMDVDTRMEYAVFLKSFDFLNQGVEILKAVDSNSNFRKDYYLLLYQFYSATNQSEEANKAYTKAVKCGASSKLTDKK